MQAADLADEALAIAESSAVVLLAPDDEPGSGLAFEVSLAEEGAAGPQAGLAEAGVTAPQAAPAASTSAATPGGEGAGARPPAQLAAAAVADAGSSEPAPLHHHEALQLWVLRACQQLKGGLRDKPGKSADYYHTCYCLSGLAAAQQAPGARALGPGGRVNELAGVDPLLNVVTARCDEAARHYAAAAGGVG